ncbi:Holliday junction DNA helicase subunit RuvA [Branchiibius hedensis]|uniref:Holliday junction branch migration complex subunit RuvA n=1 Tax=Branchiibius hedensis TaxID=672460 RepID=A0A2Y8ZPD6_9MICO|nr:Holliday junction branch migration protein RuvA [Branchiibius hedensis]PWJ24980.1 Holliday junction DNA helicase subunit RuvA [Branchiibius hedensis]SSA33795.1 Holliday junction DNA helicase subunit RuvA [Branchiibius hedensis]
MIASLAGTVAAVGLDHLVIEVGGVGLLVHTTPATASATRPGTASRLATSLVVREDSLTLFGFDTAAERDLFELVQTVSGVGPRLALAMLAVHAPDPLRAAIAGSDVAALTKVPGIGKKGAERIVLELKDKVGAPAGAPGAVPSITPSLSTDQDQVVEALVGLGWNAKQAGDAVLAVTAEVDGLDVAETLRAALRRLGR